MRKTKLAIFTLLLQVFKFKKIIKCQIGLKQYESVEMDIGN